MTDTTTLEESTSAPARRSGSLTALRLAELQGLALSMGITGTAKMRKGDLVLAIKARQNGESGPAAAPARATARAADAPPAPVADRRNDDRDSPRRDVGAGGHQEDRAGGRRDDRGPQDRRDGQRDGQRDDRRRDERSLEDRREPRRGDGREDRREDRRSGQQGQQQGQGQGQQGQGQQGQGQQGQGQGQQGQGQQQGQGFQNSGGQGPRDDDGDGRGGRRRRNRNRNRDKRRAPGTPGVEGEPEPQIAEDDVLVPVAGILDVLDSYAFVRTTGYLPGSNDVYVPLGMVKRNGLRKGDAVTGAIKVGRDGEETQQQTVGGRNNRQKFNPLARLDTVNGMTPDEAQRRPEFGKLTPLYPQDRLRLETEQNILTTRIIDLVAPIGKGQRGLIVAPAKAGKTMVMQALANAVTTNNPECHLMVVLVDERPEEVTDMQRAVKGEVISSTFDRPADDHTTVAELAIERAKRLVEMGHDVVVLLDSITKLGRAYNLAAPASGRILSGGVDSAALYPPKKFFGAARNIEHGGSLTILATALVETGSRMDEVIFEEFKGTGNMELRLDRQLANRRIFPAVEINNSGTRKEEILLAPEELKIMWKLRRVLAALDSQQGIELLLDRLRKTRNNYEFLMQVQQTSSIKLDDEDD
ncbi:MAG TPA: transcription termination factor Rho [Dermatophilaceae bacterium]|nr:transcription termination factor Rho [Dermatophilaceae bacterium]